MSQADDSELLNKKNQQIEVLKEKLQMLENQLLDERRFREQEGATVNEMVMSSEEFEMYKQAVYEKSMELEATNQQQRERIAGK